MGNGHFNDFFADFNSIKVRLERTEQGRTEVYHPFQFHKGTIRTFFPCCLCPWLQPFQFHKGTIRTCSQNSPLYRLDIFQFHKGTIRTIDNDQFMIGSFIFQFHKGTIRTWLLLRIMLLILNFNSIKVRLELVIVHLMVKVSLFQFHKGTIRTSKPASEPALRTKFQFHKGTIRTGSLRSYTIALRGISIP